MTRAEAMDAIADGQTYRAVSAKCDISVSHLQRLFAETGRRRKPRPKSNIKPATLEAARLCREGMSYREAANRTGAAINSVWWAVQYGWAA